MAPLGRYRWIELMTERSDDDMYRRACEFVIRNQTSSISRLQLEFRVAVL